MLQKLFYLSVLLITLGACQRVEVMLSSTEQANTDDEKIRKYLADQGIANYLRTPSGNYVVIREPRSDQRFIRTGDFVYLRYKGYFPTTDGTLTYFDTTTVDSSKSAPYRFDVGRSSTIAGWQDAMRYFRNKEKGTIFLPSNQGYGSSAVGSIPANQILIFDLNIEKVE